MSVIIDGGAGITFPDTRQQTNAMTMTGGNPRYYAARAWVNFDGIGTVAIRSAVNVSSITDLGAGTYRVNMATAMPDANYAVIAVGTQVDGGSNNTTQLLDGASYTTTQFTLLSQSGGGTNTDLEIGCAAVFR